MFKELFDRPWTRMFVLTCLMASIGVMTIGLFSYYQTVNDLRISEKYLELSRYNGAEVREQLAVLELRVRKLEDQQQAIAQKVDSLTQAVLLVGSPKGQK
jgi:hypothetical protein